MHQWMLQIFPVFVPSNDHGSNLISGMNALSIAIDALINDTSMGGNEVIGNMYLRVIKNIETNTMWEAMLQQLSEQMAWRKK